MWLSDLSIKRPVFITMLVIAVSVVGGMFYFRMPVDLFPDVSIPVVAVRTIYPGTTPSEVEMLLSKPIEEAVSSLSHVEAVTSRSQESASLVMIEYSLDYSSEKAADDVRRKVASIRGSLPTDAHEPEVLRFDPSSNPILSFAIADRAGELGAAELRQLVDDKLVPRIQRVPDVGAVNVTGGLEREVHVDLNLDRIRAQGLAVQQVVGAIRGENLSVPGGRITEGERERLIRTDGEFGSLDDLAGVPILTPRGATVLLRDLATVSDGFADQRAITRLNGSTSVVVDIQKQSGTNTVRVADGVKVELEGIRRDYPDLDIQVAVDQSTFTRESTEDVLVSILLGALLAAAVVLAFFRDLRNTLVTIAGLPVVILGTFVAAYLCGFTLNMITLLALSISIGMLIDDAIVVRENIFRHMEAGEEPKEAASRGTAEIALAVIATTLTIVAVFAPIAFTPGIAGRFLREFGVTVSLAVLISLVEAFTLAPMLSAYFFKKLPPRESRADRFEGAWSRVERGYRRTLGWAVTYRLVVVGVGVATLVASLAMLPLMKLSFVSDFDRSELAVNLEMAPGTTLAEMDRVTLEVENRLRREPEVRDLFTLVGSGGVEGSVERATIRVMLDRKGAIEPVVARIRPDLAKLPGVRYDIDLSANTFTGMMMPSTTGSRSSPLRFSVQGPSLADLDVASAEIVAALGRIPGVVDVDRSLRAGRPELRVEVDRPRAADLGISTAQVGATVRTLVNGETATKYRAGDEEYDVVVRLRPADRDRASEIAELPLVTNRGSLVPLSAIARLVPSAGPASITRLNRQREVTVGAGYSGRQLGEVTNDAKAAIAALDLPAGVTVDLAGETKYMEEAFSNLLFALILSVLFIYVVLASQFESFIHPFTVMLALPLSFVGALFALLVTGQSVDMVALIGIILLMGLVTKNSILLVDFTNALKREGHSTREAVLRAGPIRLRPIAMTTFAMIFGMLPVALGYGAGAEIRTPMAIAVIGGLITSTLLTLIVVPVAYTLIDDLTARLRRWRAPAAPAQG